MSEIQFLPGGNTTLDPNPKCQRGTHDQEPIIAELVGLETNENSKASNSRSTVEWFLDAFLRKENIRWLAVIGAAIVVASSLMLVTHQWKLWHPAYKFLAILGYTALTYAFSEFGRKNLGLQVTSRVLQFLTILLLPMTFLALSWFSTREANHWNLALHIGLSIPAIALTWFAGSKIFEYLWRGKETTFLVSYVLLCVAGALPSIPSTSTTLATLSVLAYWLIATVGSIKINRFLFWNAEEHRFPKAFGFLPIALLGIQFIALTAIKTGVSIRAEWMGVIVVLSACTVLGTTQTLASVHRKRTGALLRPMPLNIILPLFIGVAMAILGIGLAFYGFSVRSEANLPLILSTVLAAGLMFLVARETDQSLFVWMGLILAMVAYQLTPTLFTELISIIKEQSAVLVQEPKLPIGFYGLTYLPFLLAIACASRSFSLRNNPLFAIPMKHLTTILTVALWGLSITHFKSMVMVASVNMFLFPLFAILFRDRRYALPAFFACTIVAMFGIQFWMNMSMASTEMNHWSNAGIWGMTSVGIMATVLVTSSIVDRAIARIPSRHSSNNNLPLVGFFEGENLIVGRAYGVVLTIMLATFWITIWSARILENVQGKFGIGYAPWTSLELLVPLALIALNFATLAIRNRSYLWSFGGWCLPVMLGLQAMASLNVSDSDAVNFLSIFGVTTVLVTTALLADRKRPSLLSSIEFLWESQPEKLLKKLATCEPPTASTVSKRSVVLYPLHDICYATLTILLSTIFVPWFLLARFVELKIAAGMAAILVGLLILSLWKKSKTASLVYACLAPISLSAILAETSFIDRGSMEVVFAWGGMAIANLLLFRTINRSEYRPAFGVSKFWLMACIGLSCLSLQWSVRAAAIVALVVYATIELEKRRKTDWTILGIAVNLQAFLLAVGCLFPNWGEVYERGHFSNHLFAACMLVSALSVLFWDHSWKLLDEGIRSIWSHALRLSFIGFGLAHLFNVVFYRSPDELFFLAIGIASIAELIEAVRKQNGVRAWTAFTLCGFGAAWFANNLLNLLQVEMGLMVFSLAGLGIENRLRNHPRLAVIAQPLRTLSVAIPGLVSLISLSKIGLSTYALRSWESLILAAAASIYFHLGIVTGKRIYWLGSAIIVNLASIMLWTSFNLRDPQFYMVPFGLTLIGMVELMKNELPSKSHSPIRYMGAIVVLVSPMLEILNGSWLHLLTLLILSVLLICMSIGLRVRPLIYTGTGFLMIDLVGMVVLSAYGHPGMLWIAGLAIGVGVIALAAICENRREQLLSSIRMLSAELATWN